MFVDLFVICSVLEWCVYVCAGGREGGMYVCVCVCLDAFLSE